MYEGCDVMLRIYLVYIICGTLFALFSMSRYIYTPEYMLTNKMKNVSCENDRLNGWNSTLQTAWYIRHFRWTCAFCISFIIWCLWTKRTIWLLILTLYFAFELCQLIILTPPRSKRGGQWETPGLTFTQPPRSNIHAHASQPPLHPAQTPYSPASRW